MDHKTEAKQRPGALKVHPGDVFGHLKVIERAGSDKWGSSVWQCLCDCGKTVVIRGGHLTAGKSTSCGCSRGREGAEKSRQKNIRHGMKQTRLYRIWCAMKSRCLNQNNTKFEIYGGRGINVCDAWRGDFTAFYEWSMSHGYRDNLTIDRIDRDGNYCPENCRWVSQKVQQNNRSNNHIITANGQTKTISEWADKSGLSAKTIQTRLQRGWTEGLAATSPLGTRREKHE